MDILISGKIRCPQLKRIFKYHGYNRIQSIKEKVYHYYRKGNDRTVIYLLWSIIERNGNYSRMADDFLPNECVVVAWNNVNSFMLFIPIDSNSYKMYVQNSKLSTVVSHKDVGSAYAFSRWQTRCIFPLHVTENVYDYFNDMFLEILGLASEYDHFVLENEVRRQFVSV
jgi:hypothetical protein